MSRRVKQDAAQADALIEELARQQGDGDEQGELDAQALAGEVEGEQEGGVEMVGEPEGEPAVQDPPQDNAAELRAELEKSNQRYRSLEGMFRSTNAQLESMREIIASMQAAPPAPAEPASQEVGGVDDRDEAAFGADLVQMVVRAAKSESGRAVAGLEQRLQKLEQALGGVTETVQATAKDSFQNRLSKFAPGWETTDTDPGFIAWLQEQRARHQVFATAVTEQNAEEVAWFYNEYASMQAAPQEQRQTAAAARQERLEKQVAPGRARTTPRTPAEPKVFTRSEIAQFYSSGKKAMKAEEFARMEREIFKAQQDGRVDYSR